MSEDKGRGATHSDDGAFPQTKKDAPQPAVGIVLTVLVAVLAVGLLTFAGPCADHEGLQHTSCFWAWRALLGVAGISAILSIVRIFEPDEGERRGLSLSCALLGVLIAAIPGGLIDLCSDPSMACNAIMRPFALAIGIAMALVGGVDLTRRLMVALRPASKHGSEH